ncbi:alpha/beta fold hydrolase [Streptomyces sp. NPDC096205]|uniref:alpha/beta fold hydrolase n=1 Tax=Streptomyces sp. NPDC096205 TaxID=3366081 RepID=UPI00380948F3
MQWHCPAPSVAPILLVPGGAQTMSALKAQAEALSQHAITVSVDLPMDPGRNSLPADASLEHAANELHDVIEELDLGPVNLLGLSAGAHIAYAIALHHPATVAQVALGGLCAELPDDIDDLFALGEAMVGEGRVDMLADLVSRRVMCEDGSLSVRKREVLHAGIKRRIMGRSTEQLKRDAALLRAYTERVDFLPKDGLTQPTLFFTGEYDALTPLEAVRPLADRCTDARLFSIRDSDHLAILERTNEVADMVARFFSGRPLESLPYGQLLSAQPA